MRLKKRNAVYEKGNNQKKQKTRNKMEEIVSKKDVHDLSQPYRGSESVYE